MQRRRRSPRIPLLAATLPAPIFYICGPPGMVEAMRTMLTEAGYDEDDVRSEEFYGY